MQKVRSDQLYTDRHLFHATPQGVLKTIIHVTLPNSHKLENSVINPGGYRPEWQNGMSKIKMESAMNCVAVFHSQFEPTLD